MHRCAGRRRLRTGIGLDGPNSVAVSPDGRNVYATSLKATRSPSSGATPRPAHSRQAGGARRRLHRQRRHPGCATGARSHGPDVVAVSPDGTSVYVGAFMAARSWCSLATRRTVRSCSPPAATGCIAETPTPPAPRASRSPRPEGSRSAPTARAFTSRRAGSSALDVFARDLSTGALTQATDGSGCIAQRARRLQTGGQLSGADAVAISPDDGRTST